MKIKMKTTSCGPDSRFNFHKNQVRDVSEEEARYWHSLNLCELIDNFPNAEKAVIKPIEKAVAKNYDKAVKVPDEVKTWK